MRSFMYVMVGLALLGTVVIALGVAMTGESPAILVAVLAGWAFLRLGEIERGE